MQAQKGYEVDFDDSQGVRAGAPDADAGRHRKGREDNADHPDKGVVRSPDLTQVNDWSKNGVQKAEQQQIPIHASISCFLVLHGRTPRQTW